MLSTATAEERLSAIVDANFDETQVHPAVAKAWLDFWASSLHQPGLHRLQKISSRRLYSTLTAEFHKVLNKEHARIAGYGLAALIDGLWLRAALSGSPFDPQTIKTITRQFIHQQLASTHS